MRRAILAVAVAVVAGCGEGADRSPRSQNGTGQTPSSERRAKLESTRTEPEADSRPPRFDAADGNRTLRWIASLTEPFRKPAPARGGSADQGKAAREALAEAVRQTVKWKMPVEAVKVDGSLLFSPFRTTAFPDRSEKHPEIALRVRPWNAVQLESSFACPADPWRLALRPGSDSITVSGQIVAINTADLYNWHVSLYDIHFAPDGDAAPPPAPAIPPPEEFDPGDPDKSFAWLRQQLAPALDPFGTPGERERRKSEATARLRALTGTKVRWRWPSTVASDSAVATQDLAFADYSRQMAVAMSLWLKNPATPSPRQPPYIKAFAVVGKNKVIDPEVIAKVRESKKSTISGKVAKLLFAEAGNYPPQALEIGVRLDDVSIEP